jgi:hypothetical protein
MKKILVVVTINAFFLVPALAERPRLDGREAPRATDLLRAERLAEQARKRLEMPAARSSGWKHGGTGWGEPDAAEPREPRDVIIDLNSPRRPRRAPQ